MTHPKQDNEYNLREDIKILPYHYNSFIFVQGFVALMPIYQVLNKRDHYNYLENNFLDNEFKNKQKPLENYQVYPISLLMEKTKIDDIRQIMHFLNSIDFQNYKWLNEDYGKVEPSLWYKFLEILNSEQLLPNDESQINAIYVKNILTAFQSLGYETLELSNITTEILEINISDFIKNNEEILVEPIVSTPDKKIILTLEYEHTNPFIFCNDKNLLEKFIKLANIEGFYMNDKTTLLWDRINIEPNIEYLELKRNFT